jgi:hypothetical protein
LLNGGQKGSRKAKNKFLSAKWVRTAFSSVTKLSQKEPRTMNSRRTIFLLAFLTFFISCTTVATAADPKSDDPRVQKIIDSWAARDAATKNICVEMEKETTITKGFYDKRFPEGKRPPQAPKGPIPPKDITHITKTTLLFNGKTQLVKMKTHQWDMMVSNSLQEVNSTSGIKNGKTRVIVEMSALPFPMGHIMKMDKKHIQRTLLERKEIFIVYFPIRFFKSNGYLDKAKIVDGEEEINGRKCVQLEIPMKNDFFAMAKGKAKSADKSEMDLKCLVCVDQSKDCLPMKYQEFAGDGKPFIDLDFDYDFSGGDNWKLANKTENEQNSPFGKLVNLEINKDIDPAAFNLEFPVGTLVRVVDPTKKMNTPAGSAGGVAKDKKKIDKDKVDPNHYFVLENGKKSTVAETEKRMRELGSKMKGKMEQNREAEAKHDQESSLQIACFSIGGLFVLIAGAIFFVKRRAKG